MVVVVSLLEDGGLLLIVGEDSVVLSLAVVGGLSSVNSADSVAALLVAVGVAAGCKLARKASKSGSLPVLFHDLSIREDQATYAAVRAIASNIHFPATQDPISANPRASLQLSAEVPVGDRIFLQSAKVEARTMTAMMGW